LARGVAAEPASATAVLRDRRGKGDALLPAGNGNVLHGPSARPTLLVGAVTMTPLVGERSGATRPRLAFDTRPQLPAQPPPRRAPLSGRRRPSPARTGRRRAPSPSRPPRPRPPSATPAPDAGRTPPSTRRARSPSPPTSPRPTGSPATSPASAARAPSPPITT